MPTTRRYYVNNAPQQQISAQINNAVTSLACPSFAGWPTQFPFFATLELGTASEEIVSVTNISGTTATITRGLGGTTAITHLAGATFDMTAVAQDYDEANAHTSATAGVHGISGNVVGDSDVQTLTNKTLASPSLTGTASGVNASLSGTLGVTGLSTLAGVNASGAVNANAAGTGLAVANNATVGGTLGVTGASTVAAVTASGAVAANGAGTGLAVANNATVGGTLAVTSNITGASFTGIILPRSYTNEAAAGSPTVGCIAYLTAPTGVGYLAGLYQFTASGWVPLSGTDQTVPRFRGTIAGSTALVATTNVAFTANDDPYSKYDSTNKLWTVPAGQGGLYLISAQLRCGSTAANPTVRIMVNGAEFAIGSQPASAAAASSDIAITRTCVAGDTIALQSYFACTTSTSGDDNFLSITRIGN